MKPAKDSPKRIGFSNRDLFLTEKVALTSGVAFVLLGFLLVRLTTAIISDNFINQAQKTTSVFVQKQVESQLDPSFFDHKIRSEQEVRDQHQGFSNFFRDVQTEDVIKIKMWDDTGTIIHVHDNFTQQIDFELINKSFPDNPRFQKAIMGEVNVEVKPPTNPENVSEQGYRQLMEVYVPVYFPGRETPIGVAEVYYKLDSLNAQVKSINKIIITAIGLTFLLLYSILILVTNGASKTLQRQKSELEFVRKELEERYRAVITNTPVVIFAVDKKGIFTLSEGKGLDKLGLKPEEVVGKSAYEVYKSVPQIIENIKKTLTGKSVSSTVLVGKLFFDTYYSPIFDQKGEVVGCVGVATDITERKKVEDVLRLKTQKLERINRLMVGRELKMIELKRQLSKSEGVKNGKKE